MLYPVNVSWFCSLRANFLRIRVRLAWLKVDRSPSTSSTSPGLAQVHELPDRGVRVAFDDGV